MKRITTSLAAAALLACGTGVALAQSTGTANEPDTTMQSANDYWNQHAKDGYMSRADVINYRNGNQQGVEDPAKQYSSMDTDHDGRVSKSEWTNFWRSHHPFSHRTQTGSTH